ncbi:hypothetical protein [Natrinema hispanicum]|uniref:hypothetical protein n=1 Tax=Natrinema hispanicum TaxID=392421 RepID=UPI00122CC35A|nr:hypothetical protein [Natrinema hispanicum]
MRSGKGAIDVVIVITVTAITAIVGFIVLSPFAKRCPTGTFPDACEALIVGTGTSLQMTVGPIPVFAVIIGIMTVMAAGMRSGR